MSDDDEEAAAGATGAEAGVLLPEELESVLDFEPPDLESLDLESPDLESADLESPDFESADFESPALDPEPLPSLEDFDLALP